MTPGRVASTSARLQLRQNGSRVSDNFFLCRCADHTSRNHPVRHQRRLIRGMFQVSFQILVFSFLPLVCGSYKREISRSVSVPLDQEDVSGQCVHPLQTRKSRYVRFGRVDLGLMLDRQGGEVRVRRQITATSHRREEIEQNVCMANSRVDENRLRASKQDRMRAQAPPKSRGLSSIFGCVATRMNPRVETHGRTTLPVPFSSVSHHSRAARCLRYAEL